MRTATLCSIVLLSLMACSGEEPPATSEVARSQEVIADAVYTNGRIYTVNEQQPWVEAIAVKDGKFLVVGSESDVQAVTGDATQVVDLVGRMVMPGLIDTHIHVMGASIGKANLYLSNPNDIDAMLAEIKALSLIHI